MFGTGKRQRRQLEQSGKRAPATVVEIAGAGPSVDVNLPFGGGKADYRKATLQVQPDGEPGFEVRKRLRFSHGMVIPKAGDRIEVLYDPTDHDNVIVAPPTAQQEQQRVAAALSKADVGFQVGGLMQRSAGDQPGPAAARGASTAVNAQLAQLEALKNGGAISEADFAAAKRALLGGAGDQAPGR